MYEVELDIFSGRPNPRWTLSPAEAASLTQQILDGVTPVVPADVTDGRLGYRGYLVRATGSETRRLGGDSRERFFRIRAGLATGRADLSSEQFLTTTMKPGNQLSATEAAVITESTLGEVPAAQAAAACSLFYTDWNDFSFWNGTRQYDNNCYNYAANYASNTFAQPGRQGGQVFSALTVANIKAAMRRDGWIDDCSTGNLFVALVIAPGYDYHFYRRNLNDNGVNRWCHKPGHTPARNTDNSGAYITNPQTCDRGPYTTWGGGFMYSNGVRSRVVR